MLPSGRCLRTSTSVPSFLTKAMDVTGTERSRFVLEDARGEMISPELSDDSALSLMGDSMRHFLGADDQMIGSSRTSIHED